MKKRWVLVIILAIAVFVITDLIRRREKPIDIEAEQAAIRTLLDEFVAAENAGDIEKIMTLTADGAVVMPPNEPAVVGREAMRAWWKALYDRFSIQGAVSDVEIQAFGDWGFIRGTWNATLTPKERGEPQQGSYSFIVIVRRGADGTWREARGIWTSNQPLPEPARPRPRSK